MKYQPLTLVRQKRSKNDFRVLLENSPSCYVRIGQSENREEVDFFIFLLSTFFCKIREETT